MRCVQASTKNIKKEKKKIHAGLHWWRLRWRAKWSEREKLRSQWTHLNGLAPVCLR